MASLKNDPAVQELIAKATAVTAKKTTASAVSLLKSVSAEHLSAGHPKEIVAAHKAFVKSAVAAIKGE